MRCTRTPAPTLPEPQPMPRAAEFSRRGMRANLDGVGDASHDCHHAPVPPPYRPRTWMMSVMLPKTTTTPPLRWAVLLWTTIVSCLVDWGEGESGTLGFGPIVELQDKAAAAGACAPRMRSIPAEAWCRRWWWWWGLCGAYVVPALPPPCPTCRCGDGCVYLCTYPHTGTTYTCCAAAAARFETAEQSVLHIHTHAASIRLL